MSTATIFSDPPHPAREEDANTIITDYWLNFMSARQRDEKHESAPRNLDLESKVEGFCRRLNALSLERRTLVTGLERMHQNVWEQFSGGSRPSLRNDTNSAALSQSHMAASDRSRGTVVEASRGSLLDRVRSSGFYLTVQKLF